MFRYCQSKNITVTLRYLDCPPPTQRLSWPIASTIHRHEDMEVQVLTFNRFLTNRLLGSTTFSLHRLLDESTIREARSKGGIRSN